MSSLVVALVLVVALTLGACGGDDGQGEATTVAPPTEAPAELSPEDTASPGDTDGLVEQQEELQETLGGGGAELVIGSESWSFDSVLCGFGPDEIGDPEAEFVLSSLADGLQLYVSVDGFGHSIELTDVTNFEDPAVDWAASALYGTTPAEFVDVSGKQVSATTEFIDLLDETGGSRAAGTLTATCP